MYIFCNFSSIIYRYHAQAHKDDAPEEKRGKYERSTTLKDTVTQDIMLTSDLQTRIIAVSMRRTYFICPRTCQPGICINRLTNASRREMQNNVVTVSTAKC